MTVYTVRHVTTYRYSRPVGFGEHRLMLRPRDSYDQRLLDSQLTIEPRPAELRWLHDVFGNCVTVASFDIKCASTVKTVWSIRTATCPI